MPTVISLCSQIDLRRQQKILLKDVQYLCILSKFEGVVCAPCLENHSEPSEEGFYAMIVSKIIDENFASSITMTSQLKKNNKY